MAFANSFYNPIVYCVMNRNFRQGFKEIFCSGRETKKRGPSMLDTDETDNSTDSKVTLRSVIPLKDVE